MGNGGPEGVLCATGGEDAQLAVWSLDSSLVQAGGQVAGGQGQGQGGRGKKHKKKGGGQKQEEGGGEGDQTAAPGVGGCKGKSRGGVAPSSGQAHQRTKPY